jgi:hypothetical protein
MYFDIERLIQMSAETTLGLYSVAGGLMLLGISVARDIISRNIATRRRKLLGKFDRAKNDYNYKPPYIL